MNTIINGVDYGPLAQLIGKWIGYRGLDIAPDNEANEDKTAYVDEMVFTPSGPAENAEEQNLVSVRYHHLVRKRQNHHIFHDQIGHWIYNPSNKEIMHSLSIPRGVCLLAGGTYELNNEETIFTVNSSENSPTYGIVQSPFMLEKAQTKAFNMRMSITPNELSYRQVTSLHIYEKDFEHIDASTLTRIIYD